VLFLAPSGYKTRIEKIGEKFGAKRKLNTGEKKIGVRSGAKRKLNTDPKKIGV
jgi:hypothetical protein